MTSPTTPPATTLVAQPAHGGDAFFMLMAGAVIVSTGAIAGFSVLASWWLLPILVIAITGMAIGVVAALLLLISDGELVAPSPPARTEPEPVTTAQPVQRPALGW